MRSFIIMCGAALVAAGCATDPSTDGSDDAIDAQAEAAPSPGKADAIALDGLYATTATSLRAGDVPTVAFTADGRYVRSRCYHTRCSLDVAETDRYDVVKRSGRTYVRFWSF